MWKVLGEIKLVSYRWLRFPPQEIIGSGWLFSVILALK